MQRDLVTELKIHAPQAVEAAVWNRNGGNFEEDHQMHIILRPTDLDSCLAWEMTTMIHGPKIKAYRIVRNEAIHMFYLLDDADAAEALTFYNSLPQKVAKNAVLKRLIAEHPELETLSHVEFAF